jgi:hypothetical protein
MTDSISNQIQTLLDIEEIRNLRILYSHHLDGNRLEALDQVFTQDAIVETTMGLSRGLDQVRAGLADAVKLYDRDHKGNYPFMHAVTNHWVNLTGPDTAEGRCYLLDYETASKPDPNPLLLLGLYADAYVRVEGAWRISRSRLELFWPTRNEVGGEPGKNMILPS